MRRRAQIRTDEPHDAAPDNGITRGTALVSAVGRVKAGHLPAATVARTVYHGPYEGLGDAWSEFEAWTAAEGLRAAPNLWECYVAGPESSPDPAKYRTELNRPLVR